MLGSLFFERRDVLKSRSALLALDALVRTQPRPGSEAVAAEVEEIIASAHPFNELRVLSSLRAGWVTGKPEVVGRPGAAHRRRRRGRPPAAGAAARRRTGPSSPRPPPRRWPAGSGGRENPMTSHEMVGRRAGGGALLRGHAGRAGDAPVNRRRGDP